MEEGQNNQLKSYLLPFRLDLASSSPSWRAALSGATFSPSENASKASS